MTEEDTKARADIAKIVVLSGWALTILVCVGVIGTATNAFLTNPRADIGPLKEWAGMCLGFLFGSFVSLVKDYIKGT